MSFFISAALAEAAAPAAQQQNPLFSFVMLGGMLVIFYFLLWRPQSKRAKEQKSLIESLTKNDEVVISGGLLGRIIKVDDNYVALEIANNVEVKVQKSAVIATLPKGTIKAI